MDHQRSSSGNHEDNVGIPDVLRCKRSDGKQWRCTAKSMPDKTVCEKHYVQAKKRAANSALRASLKKSKRKSLGGTDAYLESKSDDFDKPLVRMKVDDHNPSVVTRKSKEKVLKQQVHYSPETHVRSLSARNSLNPTDYLQRDFEYEEGWRSYKKPPLSAMDSSLSRSQRSFDASTLMEYSDGSTSSSEDAGGQASPQCCRNDENRVIWCLKCGRRRFCCSCISTCFRHSDIPLEDIERVCPACRGTCNCKVCLRGDNMVKVRIREIPALDKLQYLCCLLTSLLPIVKQIHNEQFSEVELEQRLRGTDIDFVQAKLIADEQMCCNICRIPIIDYHRHCANCSYDVCLHCCQDLREASTRDVKNESSGNQSGEGSEEKGADSGQVKESRQRLNLSGKYPDWKANSDGSIPCPPKVYGGCNYLSLTLRRIFKMNWVAKLVTNVEEVVSGCKINDAGTSQKSGIDDSTCQYAHREYSDDNFLYCPSSGDLKAEGVKKFRKHWVRGEPVIVKQVFDWSSLSSWDPLVIWKDIQENVNRLVKAIDCLNLSEVDIELGQFSKGFSEARIRKNGMVEMLKLKDWSPPSAWEEFLLYKRPEFIRKLPLLEYIHSRLGLLNVAAKLPNYSLENDVGPKIYISCGTCDELGRGDSVTNLHVKMHDIVYLLVHTCEVNLKSWQENEDLERRVAGLSLGGNESETVAEKDERTENHRFATTLGDLVVHSTIEDKGVYTTMENQEVDVVSNVEEVEKLPDQCTNGVVGGGARMEGQQLKKDNVDISVENLPGVQWDVFRRQDVPKLNDFLQTYCRDLLETNNVSNDFGTCYLHDGTVFLDACHKKKLKEEYGVEPWSFQQHLGQAVFVPAGCPIQVMNLESTVQLGLDFLSPESVHEADKMAEEIRCLPNEHEAKLQVLEVGKISLYAASSAIKEVQKLVLDPKLGTEIGFEDPNLTAAVSENLEKLTKRKRIRCP